MAPKPKPGREFGTSWRRRSRNVERPRETERRAASGCCRAKSSSRHLRWVSWKSSASRARSRRLLKEQFDRLRTKLEFRPKFWWIPYSTSRCARPSCWGRRTGSRRRCSRSSRTPRRPSSCSWPPSLDISTRMRWTGCSRVELNYYFIWIINLLIIIFKLAIL